MVEVARREVVWIYTTRFWLMLESRKLAVDARGLGELRIEVLAPLSRLEECSLGVLRSVCLTDLLLSFLASIGANLAPARFDPLNFSFIVSVLPLFVPLH